jgi:hypothetical protein
MVTQIIIADRQGLGALDVQHGACQIGRHHRGLAASVKS